ncbi:MAG: hypothetical protein QRY16_12530 [Enterobacterales bacterium endosymbiont of Blomia tropicalis]|uniref:hypothetical protein n=1 Tax=Mixta mediterraneensis TaxID=2758443 RepID=UPI0025A704E3|nr:hypothetical protein [Mixta mediterraneensis]MDL4914582.1 hypothetical protein [Mixta mediterraneensis]
MKPIVLFFAAIGIAATLSACAPRHHGHDAPPPSGQQPTGAPGGSGPVGQPQS